MSVRLTPAVDYAHSCDMCECQEGRHYCLLHTEQIKNMETVACKDWTERIYRMRMKGARP